MNDSCIRIPTTAQLRTLESAWIKACHANWGMVLMEQAGMAAADIVGSLCDTAASVAVFCGLGNNGGDGLVVARHLQRLGIPVTVYMAHTGSARPADPESESAINRRIYEEALGMEIHSIASANLELARQAVFTCDLIVDALLGTGLDRDVEGVYAELINIINDSHLPVVAIDLPSGINSDTGKVMGVAVQADTTVTFGHLKAGLLHYPGAAHAGILSVVDIGLPALDNLPPALTSIADGLQKPLWWLTTAQQVSRWLPERPQASNKGTFGRLLCIAGSSGMTGSAMLASQAALRSGVGLVVLATAASIIAHLPAEEIIYHSLSETAAGTLAASNLDALEKQLALADAVILGPGMTTQEETTRLIWELAQIIDKPCIIDADGLNALAQPTGSDIKLRAPDQLVMTPHPKELSRLLGTTVSAVQSDRIAAAQAAVAKFGCNIILKGAHTVVATHDRQSYIIPTGNSGMATAGSGDVLSGIVAAMLAQGLAAPEAAVVGAYLHAAAGDLAAEQIGEDGLVAGDIMHALPQVLQKMRAGTFLGNYLEHEAATL